MTSKLRILLVIALILAAWGVGFSMGGGFRVKQIAGAATKSAGENGELSSEEARRRVGQVMQALPDGAEEAGRRVAWNRESFKRAAASFGKEGNLISYARRALQMTDSLNMEDFPMVVEAFAEVKADGRNELDGVMELFITGRWAELNPKAAAEYLAKKNQIGSFDMNRNILWSVWAGKDPAAAAAFAKQSGDSEGMKTIIESLASSDVDNALAFARIHAPELIADGSLSRALGQKSKYSDPERVAKQLESMGTFDQNTQWAILECASEWSKKDRNAAHEWARLLPDAVARQNALFGVYREWFEVDTNAAANALLLELRNGSELSEIAGYISREWKLDDWKSAAAWLVKLPSEKEMAYAATTLSNRLASDRAASGAEFLKGLPNGAARDAATAVFADRLSESDVGTAMEWALSISDAEKQRSTTRNVVAKWFNRDPAAAYQWLESGSGMTPEQRANFLSK